MRSLPRRERERQTHEGEIVAAAERVFGVKGFEAASMDEIAKEAQFTRRTIYQYFAGKEELYFAVILKGVELLLKYFGTAFENEGTGYEKICRSGQAFYRFCTDNSEMFRLMNFVGYVKKGARFSPRYQEYLKQDARLFEELAAVMEQGKADGSLRSDLEIPQSAFSLAFVLTGFFSELSLAGTTFTEHFALDEGNFVRSTLELIFKSIQAPPPK